MDGCCVCNWSDPKVSVTFVHLIRASWTSDELARLVVTAAVAMLPRTPQA